MGCGGQDAQAVLRHVTCHVGRRAGCDEACSGDALLPAAASLRRHQIPSQLNLWHLWSILESLFEILFPGELVLSPLLSA